MPTGYTSNIEKGNITTGNDFLMLCAREFGACIEMRDEPLDTEIPEKCDTDDYYSNSLEEANQELKKYKSMTEIDAAAEVEAEYNKRQAEAQKGIEKNKLIRERYMKILDEVKEWIPPTSEHTNLKDFAIKQIEMCLPEDKYWVEKKKIPKSTAKEWLSDNISSCLHDIEYYSKQMREEEERVNGRNKWISDLRDSLKK